MAIGVDFPAGKEKEGVRVGGVSIGMDVLQGNGQSRKQAEGDIGGTPGGCGPRCGFFLWDTGTRAVVGSGADFSGKRANGQSWRRPRKNPSGNRAYPWGGERGVDFFLLGKGQSRRRS